MIAKDYQSLAVSALAAHMPPHALIVLLALMTRSNTRWQCRPSIRALADIAHLNKDTVVLYSQWLADANIITRTGGNRTGYRYQIQHKSLWRLSGPVGQISGANLSDTTAQISVRPRRTVSKSKLPVICPVPSDCIYKHATRMSSETSSEGEFVEAPHRPNGHHHTP